MSRSLIWKFLLILGVIALAAWRVHPVDEQINLGLDLSGGVHIVMRVDTESAIGYERNQVQSRIGQALKDEGIDYDAVTSERVDAILVQGTDPARAGEVREILDRFTTDWDRSSAGAGGYRLSMPIEYRNFVASQAVESTLETLRNRVDQLGVKEPLIQKQGMAGDRILIQLPGVEDIVEVHEILGEAALLEWKEVTYPSGANAEIWAPPPTPEGTRALFGGTLPADTEIFMQRAERGGVEQTFAWPLKTVSTIIGNDLKDARRDIDEWNRHAVAFELTQEAARRFAVATRENLNKRMAIVLDGNVISVPVIQSQIRDQGRITGDFTQEEAEKLAIQLRSGALPTEIEVMEERTVGPSLGLDSIKAGVTAIAIGFGGILLFMVIYYRLSGINAVVALALNVLLVLGAMAYFGATLTLPGIAGLVLVVGMAVDSNVLIFERIREELRLGKTVRSAVDQGFSRAFMTILDCNVTTLVAALFLFSYGTGPVRGFAVTLTIGLLASMFTAVFVSRQLFALILGESRRVESLSI